MMLGISPAFPAALTVAAFERMSEKVEQLEAEADVSKQLALTSSTGKGTSLESKFKQVRHPCTFREMPALPTFWHLLYFILAA